MIKRERILGALLMFSFVAGSPHQSQATSAGTKSGNFLKLSVGARYLAMGQTGSAFVNDADATYWNPARLVTLKRPSLSLMHHTYVASIRFQSLSYAFPSHRLGSFGTTIQSLRTETLDFVDNTGQRIGHFSPRNVSMGVSWARSFLKHASLGATAKRIQFEIAEADETYAFDAGFAYQWPKASLAFTAQNMGGKIKLDQDEISLPLVLRTGWAIQLTRPWLLSVETLFPNDEDASIGAGSEYRISLGQKSELAVRGGYTTRNQDLPGLRGVTLGGGWRFPLFEINYAWVPFGDLEDGQTQNFSLVYYFSGVPKALALPTPQPQPHQKKTETKQVEKFFKTSFEKITVLDSLNKGQKKPGKIQKKLSAKTIFMKPGQAHFTNMNRRKLESVARLLIKNPSLKIEIEGHANGTPDYFESKQLSTKWAEITKKYLIFKKGIDADRLQIRVYGNRRPIQKQPSDDNQRINNRIEFKHIK